MKPLFSVLWKAVLLFVSALAGFVIGISIPALRVSRVLSHTAANVRTYDFDWLIAVLLVWSVLVLAGLLRKRMREVITATIALVLVILMVTLFTQIGIKNTPV